MFYLIDELLSMISSTHLPPQGLLLQHSTTICLSYIMPSADVLIDINFRHNLYHCKTTSDLEDHHYYNGQVCLITHIQNLSGKLSASLGAAPS